MSHKKIIKAYFYLCPLRQRNVPQYGTCMKEIFFTGVYGASIYTEKIYFTSLSFWDAVVVYQGSTMAQRKSDVRIKITQLMDVPLRLNSSVILSSTNWGLHIPPKCHKTAPIRSKSVSWCSLDGPVASNSLTTPQVPLKDNHGMWGRRPVHFAGFQVSFRIFRNVSKAYICNYWEYTYLL